MAGSASLQHEYAAYLQKSMREIIESVTVAALPDDVPWVEIRDIVQKLYTEIANHDNLTISLEKTYLLIFQVCKQQPELLLYFLEKEALAFLVELKTQLNVILTDPQLISGGERVTSRTLVQSIWTLWDNLSTSIKIFNGLLIYLHNFIKEYHVNFNFGGINQVLFYELLLSDPLIARYIRISRAMMRASARSGSKSNIPDKFIAFEATLRGIALKSPFMKNEITIYHFIKMKGIPKEQISSLVGQLRDIHLDVLEAEHQSLEDEENSLMHDEEFEEDDDDAYYDDDEELSSEDDADEDFDEREYENVPQGQDFDYVESEEEENAVDADLSVSESSNDSRSDDLLPPPDPRQVPPGQSESSENFRPVPDPRSVDELVEFIQGSARSNTDTHSKSKRKRQKKKKKKPDLTATTPAFVSAATLNPAVGPFPKFWDEESIDDPALEQQVETEVALFRSKLEQISSRPENRLKVAHFDDLARFSRENPKNLFRHLYLNASVVAENASAQPKNRAHK